MRKWVIACVPLLLTACAVGAEPAPQEIKQTEVVEETVVDETAELVSSVADSFNRLTSSAPTEQEVLDFLDMYLLEVPEKQADNMVLEFERVQKQLYRKRLQFIMQDDVQETFLLAFSHGKVPTDLGDIEEHGLRNYIDDLRNSGYRLEIRDGLYTPVIDYGFYDRFDGMISEGVQRYFQLMKFSKETLYTSDQILPITWDQVFERILAFEKYLEVYPESERLDAIQANYEYYVKLYLYGTEGTPAFPYDTRALDEWLKISYSNVFLGNDKSSFVVQFKNYSTVLVEAEFMLTEAVENQRNQMISNLGMKLVY